MKFVIAPDSFKGSLSSPSAAEAIKRGILKAIPDAECIIKPIADGGEGTLDAIVPPADRIYLSVSGPLFDKVDAVYGISGDTAVIEMATAAGLTLLPEKKRNAGRTTTYGVGELIINALGRGYRKIMLTAGGSATNDGGAGMLAALGASFTDCQGRSFIPTGDTLADIADIDLSGLDPLLFESEITVATDVENPLLGALGATFVYGPQKGLENGQRERLEAGMTHYADLLERSAKKCVRDIGGSGAGGGIAVPLLALFGAVIRSGIDTVLNAVSFDAALEGASAVITGEGRIDVQSLYGKAISGVANRAFDRRIPVYCFVGSAKDQDKLSEMGISGIYTVIERARDLSDAMSNTEKYLSSMAEEFGKTLL